MKHSTQSPGSRRWLSHKGSTLIPEKGPVWLPNRLSYLSAFWQVNMHILVECKHHHLTSQFIELWANEHLLNVNHPESDWNCTITSSEYERLSSVTMQTIPDSSHISLYINVMYYRLHLLCILWVVFLWQTLPNAEYNLPDNGARVPWVEWKLPLPVTLEWGLPLRI